MEVSILGSRSVKIKSKVATFAVTPIGLKSKVVADAVLLFEKGVGTKDLSLENETLIINGPGEYEIKGVKLSGLGKAEIVAYTGRMDSIDLCIAKASMLSKGKDVLGEYNMVIIEEDVLVDQSVFASLNASVIIVYGEKAAEHVKGLGKEVLPVSKYVITRDKLPGEMEVILLG
jgi:hypothetical protein